MTDDTAALVARMKEAAKKASVWQQKFVGTPIPVQLSIGSTLALIAAYEEAVRERDAARADRVYWLNMADDLENARDDARAERDALVTRLTEAKSQLPTEMQDCTILFKECEKGHGWLTATNWAQHGCPTCERDALSDLLRQAGEALDLGKRLVDYFASNRSFFEGGGTPMTFIQQSSALLASIEAALLFVFARR